MDIQKEIDLCALHGGGIVTVPSGNYRTGTIFMRNGVTLHLESGVHLTGSDDIQDYPLPVDLFSDGANQLRGRSLILAENVSDIGITGNGVIDGNGKMLNASDATALCQLPEYPAQGIEIAFPRGVDMSSQKL